MTQANALIVLPKVRVPSDALVKTGSERAVIALRAISRNDANCTDRLDPRCARAQDAYRRATLGRTKPPPRLVAIA